MALACAFGNSFTLPAVFFMSLLPPPLADRALGYAAVFMLAWSPALWSLGYAMVVGGSSAASQAALQLSSPAAAAAAAAAGGPPPPSSSSGGPRARQQQPPQPQPPGAGAPGGLRRIVTGPDWEIVEGMPPAEAIPFPVPPGSGSPGVGPGEASQQQQQQQGTGQPRHPAAFDRVMQ